MGINRVVVSLSEAMIYLTVFVLFVGGWCALGTSHMASDLTDRTDRDVTIMSLRFDLNYKFSEIQSPSLQLIKYNCRPFSLLLTHFYSMIMIDDFFDFFARRYLLDRLDNTQGVTVIGEGVNNAFTTYHNILIQVDNLLPHTRGA